MLDQLKEVFLMAVDVPSPAKEVGCAARVSNFRAGLLMLSMVCNSPPPAAQGVTAALEI